MFFSSFYLLLSHICFFLFDVGISFFFPSSYYVLLIHLIFPIIVSCDVSHLIMLHNVSTSISTYYIFSFMLYDASTSYFPFQLLHDVSICFLLCIDLLKYLHCYLQFSFVIEWPSGSWESWTYSSLSSLLCYKISRM